MSILYWVGTSGADGIDVSTFGAEAFMSWHMKAGAGNDEVRGGFNKDTIEGNEGDDVLLGHEGDDQLFGGIGNDVLFGDEDNDILFGDEDNDVLYGGLGADTLNGGLGSDELYGGANDDTLVGGAGSDTLTGGSGTDYFAFDAIPSPGEIDTILDFSIVESDKIQIDQAAWGISGIEDFEFDNSTGNLMFQGMHFVTLNNLNFSPDNDIDLV